MLKNNVRSNELLEIMKNLATDGLVTVKSKASLAKEFNYTGVNPTACISRKIKQLIRVGEIEEVIINGTTCYKILNAKKNSNSISQKNETKIKNNIKQNEKLEYNLRYVNSEIGIVIPVCDIAKNVTTIRHTLNNIVNRNKNLHKYVTRVKIKSTTPQKCLTIEGVSILLNILHLKYKDESAKSLDDYILLNKIPSNDEEIKDRNLENELKLSQTETISKEQITKEIKNTANEEFLSTEDYLMNQSEDIFNELFNSFGKLQEVVEGYGTKIIDYENNLDKLNRKLETERIKYKDIMDNIRNIKTSKSN